MASLTFYGGIKEVGGNPYSTPASEASAYRKIISLSEQDYAEDIECGNLHKKIFLRNYERIGILNQYA